MSPEHHHAAAEFNRAFAIGIALNTGQHADAVDVRCLAWQFSTSLAYVIFGALTAGLSSGWAITSALPRKRTIPVITENPL